MPDPLLRCPHCGAQLMRHPDGNDLWCQFCGAAQTDPDAVQAFARREATTDTLSSYDPPRRDWDMPAEERHALDDAWKSIQTGDRASAIFVLGHLLDKTPNSADAWYLMSLTTDDPSEKWADLTRALEAQPYHDYAWRDRGVLEGVIPAGKAPDVPDLPPGDAVDAQAQTPVCPMCGGALAFDAAAGALICAHCGHQPGTAASPAPARRQRGYQRLENALLQRRFGFSRAWDVGARLLECPSCGALLTLGAAQLSTCCPFCDSAQVLVKDAVGSFEQPDALIPFTVDRQAAANALHARLNPELRAQIERGEMWALYLPFWAFEGTVFITLPAESTAWQSIMPGVYAMRDVLVSGVTRPGQAVLYELLPYDLRGLIAYDARYLARWTAHIYTTDVIQASVTARAYLKYEARRMATGAPPLNGDLARTAGADYHPPDTPPWRATQVELQEINYRLILLPVWIITLIQRDGTHRPATVNGQTGEAVLAAGFDRLDTILAGPNRPPFQQLPLVPVPAPPPARSRSTVIRPIAPLRHSSIIRPIAPPPRRRTR